MQALDAWRAKFGKDEKPKMIFLNVSGGGKRAALWALTVLQTVDEQTQGKFTENTMLITGASGGIIGASYYRELKLREKEGEAVNPYDPIHRKSISADNLNPLIFSFLANDIFVGFTKYEYGGFKYVRDRGYTFDEELNGITDKMMDKSISAYHDAEQESIIPMMILSPIITNDGRKLYIASQPVSYMNFEIAAFPEYPSNKISGVDFHKLFEEHGSANLRFLSALRMSATFPYITPNTTLPTDPPIEIMDAGVSDNFGISNTLRFLYSFKDWIAENTGGVIIVSIRDSPKLGTISPKSGESIVDNLTQPISNVYNTSKFSSNYQIM
ncbi:MAG: patatin-like phospholipase family protein, partial [Flammeovirgaceae bacterium]|nr:patatin-like phospholipase family protein [Flammeovirgaceae bacterium]